MWKPFFLSLSLSLFFSRYSSTCVWSACVRVVYVTDIVSNRFALPSLSSLPQSFVLQNTSRVSRPKTFSRPNFTPTWQQTLATDVGHFLVISLLFLIQNLSCSAAFNTFISFYWLSSKLLQADQKSLKNIRCLRSELRKIKRCQVLKLIYFESNFVTISTYGFFKWLEIKYFPKIFVFVFVFVLGFCTYISFQWRKRSYFIHDWIARWKFLTEKGQIWTLTLIHICISPKNVWNIFFMFVPWQHIRV
jgi:hypothetical protein